MQQIQKLTVAFLKIFFRNRRAMFWVIILPSAIFFLAALLGLGQVIRFDLEGLSYSDFLLSGIVAYAIMQTGIYTVAYNLVDMKRLGVLRRLFLTPLKAHQFFLGQVLARYVIALLQTAVLLIIGLLVFQTKLSLQLLWLPIIVLFGNTLFLSFGFIISAGARDYEEAAPYTSVVGLSLTFLGDLFFPVANLPNFLQVIADYLPLKPLTGFLRYSILSLPPENIVHDLIVAVVWFILIMSLAIWLFPRRLYR